MLEHIRQACGWQIRANSQLQSSLRLTDTSHWSIAIYFKSRYEGNSFQSMRHAMAKQRA